MYVCMIVMISQEEGRIFFEIDRRNFYIILLTKSVMCVQKCIPIFYLLLRSMITCTSRLFDSPCGPCVIAWTKEKVVISFLRPLRKRECAPNCVTTWQPFINNNKLIWKWCCTHHPGTGGGGLKQTTTNGRVMSHTYHGAGGFQYVAK